MKLEDYKSGELVLELFHRADVETMFVEPCESVNLNIDGAAMIIIDRNY